MIVLGGEKIRRSELQHTPKHAAAYLFLCVEEERELRENETEG